MNIVAEPLLKLLYKKDEADFKKFSGYFGFFFSIGCFIGLVMQNFLLKQFGKIKLAMLIEGFSIAIAILHSIQSLNFLLVLRVASGIVGGLSIAFLAVLSMDMFVATKANISTVGTSL